MLAEALRQGLLEDLGPLIRRAGFTLRLNEVQRQRVEACLARFRQDPWHPPNLREAEALLGRELLQALLEEGVLVRLSEEVVLLKETWEEGVARIRQHLQERGTLSAAEARDLLQTSRKIAVALLEQLDAMGITRRVGDVRVLTAGPTTGPSA